MHLRSLWLTVAANYSWRRISSAVIFGFPYKYWWIVLDNLRIARTNTTGFHSDSRNVRKLFTRQWEGSRCLRQYKWACNISSQRSHGQVMLWNTSIGFIFRLVKHHWQVNLDAFWIDDCFMSSLFLCGMGLSKDLRGLALLLCTRIRSLAIYC